MPLSPEDRASPRFVEGIACDHCHDARSDEQRRTYAERHRQVGIAAGLGIGHIGARPRTMSGGGG
jgi:UPF0176 protein